MALDVGTRLGPYEILGLIGAGGMGEVYRARDTRLHRPVAVKILRTVDATTPDRLERFTREAQAAAALHHPNVLVVYDVGTDACGPFIVSELLEGETLRDRLTSGVVWPLRKGLDTAIQIGRGLAAAHARGIVHRDLKPENVFIGDDDVVKILDFGLARLVEPSATTGKDDTVSLTGADTLLGTTGYMAPEALRHGTVDHRADIFAFGAILYELLAGRRAFVGACRADVMTAVLTLNPPPLTELAVTIPASLVRIVERCLEKRRDARFQSASDLVFALEAVDPSSAPAIAPDSAVRVGKSMRWARLERLRNRRVLATLIGLLLVVAGVSGFLWRQREALQASATIAPSLPRVERLTELNGLEEFPAISPDGKSVVFTATDGGVRQIFVRLIAGGASLRITNDATDHQVPRWSPDSSSIVYFAAPLSGEAEGALWEVSALGGAPRRIVGSLGGADVNARDGSIAHFRLAGNNVELVAAPSDGSSFRVISRFPPGSYYSYPRWSPDAKWIAFQRGDGSRFDIFAVPASGGETQPLTHDNTLLSGFTWLADSRGILYSSGRRSTVPYLPLLHLWQTRFGDTSPTQITFDEISYSHPDMRADGTVVVSRMRREFDIWQFPVDGRADENARRGVRITHQTGLVQTPSMSPSGAEVVFLSDSGGHANLWVVAADGGGLRQITHERDVDAAMGVPNWSPDGHSIAFVSSRGNPGYTFGIWLVNPDGGSLRNLVPVGLGAAWSPDSRWLYYVERANSALRKVPATGGPAITVRPEQIRNVIGVSGSTLYYLIERALVDGSPEFEIRAAAPEDGPSRLLARVPASRLTGWQIQIVNPALSPDGRWLAQALLDGFTTNIWALSATTGEWHPIVDFGNRLTFIARRVSWSPDGRFVLAAVGEGDADIVLLSGLVSPIT